MRCALVVGAGYVGERVAVAAMCGGSRVVVTKRSSHGAAEVAARTGARAIVFDMASPPQGPAGTVALQQAKLEPGFVLVVTAAPCGTGGEAEAGLMEWAATSGCHRVVYLSSTGVYAPAAGALVNEDTPEAPTSARGAARLAAESAILRVGRERGVAVAVLRVAGIYGPGRGIYARLREGTFRMVGDGNTIVSRVHIDDLVSVVLRCATIDELPHSVFNVADDEATTSLAFARACAAAAGKAEFPQVSLDSVSDDIRVMVTADRRICNQRIRADLGVNLRYPTWREGLASLIGTDRTDRTDHE